MNESIAAAPDEGAEERGEQRVRQSQPADAAVVQQLPGQAQQQGQHKRAERAQRLLQIPVEFTYVNQ